MNRLLAELELLRSPKEKGDAFERVVKWVLETAPLYRGQLQRVHLWSEFPRSWGPDTGIDLVCEPVEGGLWAVQAKAYAEGSSATWREVSTFVGAAAARPEVGFLLLVTTASTVSPHVLRNLKASGKPFSILTRDSLIDLGLPTDIGLADLRPKEVRRFKPREHQEEAVRAVLKGFKSHDRGQLIQACGTGKTLTALWVHEALESNRTLVFLPSLALLAQTLQEWTRHARRPFAALAVCSDATVTDRDPMVSSVSEIGFPSTTDPEACRKALQAHASVVVFATYQSSQVIEDTLRGTDFRFELLIADEAHRATGLGSGDFTRPLSDDQIAAARRLFMTATPRIFGPRVKKAADDEDLLLASMDDEEVYGPRFHTLSFSDAIQRDLLTDYRVAIVGVDDEEAGVLTDPRAFVTLDGSDVMDPSELAAHIAVAKAMRRFGTRRMLSFHSRVSRARRFGERLPRVIEWLGEGRSPGGNVWAEAVSGSMPVRERRQILKKLEAVGEAEYGLVANARCLGEGVDVPLVDGIAFVDPKASQVDIAQAVGRAIRKAESKTGLSTIVLPVFIGASGDPEDTLGRSEFKTVWKVLDALRSHDDVLADELDALRRGLGRGEAARKLPGKIRLDLPVGVTPEFADALSLRLVEKTTSSWEYGFGVLQRFLAREGHARVLLDHYEDGFALGGWVNRQRAERRKGNLSPERVAALDAVVEWIWDPYEDDFQEGLEKLTAFASREGHTKVRMVHLESGFRLGAWVNKRRDEYRKGKLSPDRILALEAMPGWVWEPLVDNFRRALGSLRQFQDREGHARVPALHVEPDGFRLGRWVNSRRAAYQRGKLKTEHLAALEAVPGWVWDPHDDQFREGLQKLRAFQSREGHARVRMGYVENGFNLGIWVWNKIRDYRKGKLTSERIAELEELEGWSWDPIETRFQEGVAKLRGFHAREGHARVPGTYVDPDGFKLGSWAKSQRAKHRKGKLNPERIAALQAIEGWTW